VGVVLTRQPDDLGEWLADGAAFEAAGADALCIDAAPEPELDPLALTAALAAVTFRSLLITSLPSAGSPAIARTLGTIEQLSHGRLRILANAIPSGELTDIALRLGVLRRIPGDPDSRAAWRQTLLDASGRGPAGLLVPAGPRLLDILRNPDDQGGRRDLQLAQG
jgi:alkanesulfonate monooxygenase SsuD/methylene tetrahydromethanopterin reductase-like flavin-dependent oxidoreductase (luciferase family)